MDFLLRIGLFCWTVHMNRLAENVLEEHLLSLSKPYQKRIIDAGWYPEGQAEGEYCLSVMKMGEDGIHSIFYAITGKKTAASPKGLQRFFMLMINGLNNGLYTA